MLTVSLVTSPIGRVAVPPTRDHVVRIHRSAPSRASCLERRYHYRPGDIDIVPAGTGGVWTNDDPSTSLAIALSPTEANAIKLTVTNNAIAVVEDALSLTGNHGLTRTNPLERHHRDVLCGRVHTPQDDPTRIGLGRAALGL